MANQELQRYSRHIYFNPEDQEYVALCTEFPYLSAFADSPSEALEVLDAEIEAALAIYADEGWPLPQPEQPPEPQGLPSGRFVVRLPKSLHGELTRKAKQEGVSLNQLASTYLAHGLGANQKRPPQMQMRAMSDDWLTGYALVSGDHALNVARPAMRLACMHESADRDYGVPPSVTGDRTDLTLAVQRGN